MRKLLLILSVILLLAVGCNTKPANRQSIQSIKSDSPTGYESVQTLPGDQIGSADAVIAAKIIDIEPFETVYIKHHEDKLTLFRSVNNQTKFSYDLPSLDILFGEGWNQLPKSFFEVNVDVDKNFNPIPTSEEPFQWIWIYIDRQDGGMTGGYFRTAYVVNEPKKEFKQIYKLIENVGNAAEGITLKPTTITFGQNDLSFNCQETYFKYNTEVVLKNCNKNFLLYKNFSRKEPDLQGKLTYLYTYTPDKGYIYYDVKGKIIKPQILTPKITGNEVILELSYIYQNLIMASFDDGRTTERFIFIP